MLEAQELQNLPRKQVGANPQHLLVTLLGDFWHGRSVPIPSAALVELLAEFDISSASARSALSRLARRGILERHRDGRSTLYSVRKDFLRDAAPRAQRNLALGGGGAGEQWDGRWVIVTFAAADDKRHTREKLRSHLRSWGFAPIQDGLWASVTADGADVRRSLEALGISGVAAFSATLLHPADPAAGGGLIEWPVAGIAQAYREFADEYAPVRDRVAKGAVAPREALVARTHMMDEWRSLVRLDPDLPAELLPADWPRGRARALFAELYDGLGPLAEVRVRQILAQHAAQLADQACHITTTSAPASGPVIVTDPGGATQST